MRLTEKGVTQLDELLNDVHHGPLAKVLTERGMILPQATPSGCVSDVSVVIPTIGDGRALRALIEAIPISCWVIIVNDGEHDIIARDDRTVVLRTKSPFSGPATARNLGLQAVTTEFVAFIDDDVRIDPDWVSRLRATFDVLDVTIAAGRIVSAAGTGISGYLEQRACALDMGVHSLSLIHI